MSDSPTTNPPSAANEDLVARLWRQIWIDGALDRIGEVVADPYIRHTRDGTVTTSPADYALHLESVVRTIRGTQVIVEAIASTGDIVFASITLHGVNLATEAKVKISWITQYRVADGRIAEAWTMHQSDLDW